jgi:hypothetical protein
VFLCTLRRKRAEDFQLAFLPIPAFRADWVLEV